jgi:ABC-2 type transport system ATP-binding protein
MIDVQELRKQYGDLVAVDGLTFSAPAGTIFGLLGPNGAGKSTAIGCISGLLTPTSGRVAVLGHDVVRDSLAAKQQLGIVPQELALYEDLSAKDNLAYWGAAYGMSGEPLKKRVLDVLDRIGLADRAKEPVKKYSGGMKRRLNFGCGIVHQPKVLLLDEPTVGVDPQSRNQIFENILALKRLGRTLIYTTHYMEEAERLCDRIAVIDHGKLLALGTVAELLTAHGVKPVLVVQTAAGEHRAETIDPLGELNRLAASGTVHSFHVERPTLEQVFLHLTGRSLRD